MQLTKQQELFISLSLYFAEELYKKSDKDIMDMQKNQKNNRDNLLNEIAKILLSYKIIDSTLSLTLGDINKLYTRLENTINETITNEIKTETTITKNILSSVAEDKYSTNNYLFSFGKNFKLTQLSEKKLDEVVNAKINGEIWSSRIWKNKNDTAKDLKVQVKKFLKGEINVNDVEKVIKTKYNVNATNTDRLVRTEICKVQENCNTEWMKNHNINQSMWLSTLDTHTCSRCSSLDGTIFDNDDINRPIPPLHPHDRCCLVSLVDKNWKPKMRYDNQSKQNIDWQSFDDWQNTQ